MEPRYRKLAVVMTCCLAFAGCCLAAQAKPHAPAKKATLHYTVSLQSPQKQRVKVTALLTGIDPQLRSVRWKMQPKFAFVRLPEPLLDGPILATFDDQTLECQRRSPYEWTIVTGGATSVRLAYTVPLTHRTLDAVKQRDAYEYPYVTDDHGLLVSPTLFGFPEDVEVAELRVRFELPEGWEVIAPWRRVGEREFDPVAREALLNDLIAIGAWKVHEIRVGRFQGTLAFVPGQETLEQVAVDPIRRIVEYELELFGRPAEGRYLFLFGRPEAQGLAGSPKTNSMTLSVEPRLAPMAGRYLPHLIAHEFFHTWTAGVEMPGELRWVNEGFTDYYAYLVAARLDLNAWHEFANTLGEKMQKCAANPLRGEVSLVAAGGERFFQDRDAYNLIYDGGLLIGAWLDQTVRKQARGKTLDDLMRAFNNDPRWTSRDAAPTLQDFIAVVRSFAGKASAEKLEHLVTQPYDFDPLAEFAELGVKIRRDVAPPKMDLRANLDGTRVIDMDHNGLTYQIGVRPGDRLVEINGHPVANATEVRTAWRNPVGNRIRVTLKRDGKNVEIDQPLPETEEFIVPVEPWREHE